MNIYKTITRYSHDNELRQQYQQGQRCSLASGQSKGIEKQKAKSS